ncbi:MAG: hypothetical protein LBD45_02735 [Bacteroidales bacterium]|jgi:glycosyltransferase involved in cell wall biosynthesis|nr:hypothetical protein [Bacteroidales bacterium]
MAVVIPCFDEPNVCLTVQSLLNCMPPPCNLVVVVVLNAPDYAANSQIKQNEHSYSLLKKMAENCDYYIDIQIIKIYNIPAKEAGAGFARKVGMDYAIRLFHVLENPFGILVSLDADCIVATNYLQKIYAYFSNKMVNTAIIYFEHLLPDSKYETELYEAGMLYELYLRYYALGLQYACFPYPYVTMGSAFAVRADAYVKVGGMNKKQAGEDFYFLHKVFALGGIVKINDTVVYPAIRVSRRVVFGTGPSVLKILNDGCFKTFSVEAFCDLKALFDSVDNLYRIDLCRLNDWFATLPESIVAFLQLSGEYATKLPEINAHCASLKSFRKRFFVWFNAFQIVKYMHFAHTHFFALSNVHFVAFSLLSKMQLLPQKVIITSELVKLYRLLH